MDGCLYEYTMYECLYVGMIVCVYMYDCMCTCMYVWMLVRVYSCMIVCVHESMRVESMFVSIHVPGDSAMTIHVDQNSVSSLKR